MATIEKSFSRQGRPSDSQRYQEWTTSTFFRTASLQSWIKIRNDLVSSLYRTFSEEISRKAAKPQNNHAKNSWVGNADAAHLVSREWMSWFICVFSSLRLCGFA